MMRTSHRRRIGQILRESGLLSEAQLEAALAEQQKTNELLGEVLVRKGVVDAAEVKAALSIQEHLGDLEQAVRLAAGVRQALGALLLRSGALTAAELEQALAEQRQAGGRLGEACMRLGLLDERQLTGLLAFQRQQEAWPQGATPLRLGELLVTAGYISRNQLEDALDKQRASGKKLGEVLVGEGYARPAEISHGLHLQHLLVSSALAAVLSLSTLSLSGCGGGGGGETAPHASSAGVTSTPAAPQASTRDYFTMSEDSYGLIKPDFLYSSDNDVFWTIQANVANGVTDINTACVYRIDIPKVNGSLPELNKTFAIEDGSAYPKFPGAFLVLNGQKSTAKRVESGLITFTPDSTAAGQVSGAFEVTLTDYDAGSVPAPQYRLKGSFNFVMGTYGPVAAGS